MPDLNSGQVYLRAAVLRRQLALRLTLRRLAVGVFAGLALVVAAGFGTYALLLTLRPLLGEIGAAGAIGGIYLALALGLGFYALGKPASADLDQLEEMENRAREALADDVQNVVTSISAIEQRISRFRETIGIGVGFLSFVFARRRNKDKTRKD